MKTEFETVAFISRHIPASETDRQIIEIFLDKKLGITPGRILWGQGCVSKALDIQTLIRWLESGYRAFETVYYDSHTVMLGYSDLKTANVIGKLEGGRVEVVDFDVNLSDLSPADAEQKVKFAEALMESDLQPSNTLKLESKYTPTINESVFFSNFNHSIEGVGIISDIAGSGVELYCYLILTASVTCSFPGFGRSMHEKGIVNLRDFTFTKIDNNPAQTTAGNLSYNFGLLKKALEEVGKRWYGKLYRIQPLGFCSQAGVKYWFIDDKLKVNCTVDRGTPVHKKRFFAGNYFLSHRAALIMANRFNSMLKEFLANDSWPEVGD